MGFRFVWIIFVILISGCASIERISKIEHIKIPIDFNLLQKADYIDIVYENGNFSYISYLKEGATVQKTSLTCQKNNPIFEFKNGIWIWDLSRINGKEQEIFSYLKSLNFKRVYLQINEDLEKLIPFLELAKANEIEVFALDGDPSYVINPQPLIKRIQMVRELNLKKKYFKGFQVDIEPYLFKDFNLNKNFYVEKYISLIKTLKTLANNTFELSVVIPFWFDEIYLNNTPLAFYVIDIADEVVIMSYRTNLDEIIEITESELCYASSLNKPVYLALEVNKLPDEEHFLVKKEEVLRNLIKINSWVYLVKLPHEGLKFFKSYKVLSKRLSFFDNPNELKNILRTKLPYKSFAGWIVHSLEGLKNGNFYRN